MKRTAINHLLLAAACCSAPIVLVAGEFQIRHAAEIEFQTEPGHYYQLQRSTNFVDWRNVDDPVYGHGGRERRLRSAHQDDGAQHEYFRVVISDAPTNGYAPWSFAGITLNLDDRPDGDMVQFQSETNGVYLGSSPDIFIYTFTRTGTNEVRIETHPPTYYFDRRNAYLFTFNGPGMGTWVRDRYRQNQLKDRDVGVFSYAIDGTNAPPASTNPPPVVPTEIPTALIGLAYTFQSGETPERLEFASPTTGTEFGDDTGDDEANVFTYTYTLMASNTASIVVTFRPGKWDEYTLNYSGPAQGSFVRREFKDSLLDDTDTGVFSVVGLPANNNTNAATSGGTMPTNSLSGFTYVMNDGGAIPTTLIIASAASGTELDDSAPTQFVYTYAVTGANTAGLVVRTKVDRWDEYDLVFTANSNSGTFVRREYDRNALKDTDSGTFTGAPTNP